MIAYWAAALIIVAMILLSLDYSFAEALFMSSLFLPGVVAAKMEDVDAIASIINDFLRVGSSLVINRNFRSV